MTTKRMLIDASHPEETRVVVADGARLDDFDIEVSTRRQLKGNIYLAKLTRVEPSLQAAFVDYGGNRHGFLAFNEIHPDCYQIPVADREALLAEQEAADRAADVDLPEGGEEGADAGGDDDDELERRRPRISPRHYKIQEVIKRRQIMLVQVVKEERGNKGAALTTYLSLAGRYCVLMPNTGRGGGISRKISNAADRKRLKKIVAELEAPQGMAVIVRTAGAGRSKAEVRRDYDYLLRLWTNIRETTLTSMAPSLVYEEGSLIKRSIRDMYGRDIEEIIIQGEAEYRIAKEFMKLFIPSHAKRVKLYDDPGTPLFHHYGVESQLEAMHQMTMHLKSGGYIVINPTEALVAIDVNSGRATRERHIEETALRTNLEAADEIARQLRLRDFAGLIVIDFIDMENPRNQAQVERRLKEAMKNDKARVQIGRISPFGLIELSRQRLRPSVLETSFEVCPHCAGVGMRRTTESVALAILRKCEEEGIAQRSSELIVTVPAPVALYLLNFKRRALSIIEERYRLTVRVVGDNGLSAPEYRIDRGKAALPAPEAGDREETEAVEEPEEGAAGEAAVVEKEEGDRRGRRRRPRRRRRPTDGREGATGSGEADVKQGDRASDGETSSEEDAQPDEPVEVHAETAEEPARRRRRRGKRGGRRRIRRPGEDGLEGGEGTDRPEDDEPVAIAEEPTAAAVAGTEPAETMAEDGPQVDEPDDQVTHTAGDQRIVAAEVGDEARDEAGVAVTEETREDEAIAPARHVFASAESEGDSIVEERPRPASAREDEEAASGARSDMVRRTEVVNVGDTEENGSRNAPRRGWWQRLLE